jgi:hypothetical protein
MSLQPTSKNANCSEPPLKNSKSRRHSLRST